MKKRENRERYVNIRMTESEYADLKALVENNGYLSVSRYIRDTLFCRKIPVAKVVVTDRSLRNQINRLTTEITKIGNNINQSVKKLNSLSNAKRKNGDPVINMKSVLYFYNDVKKHVDSVVKRQEQILEIVAKEYPDNGK